MKMNRMFLAGVSVVLSLGVWAADDWSSKRDREIRVFDAAAFATGAKLEPCAWAVGVFEERVQVFDNRSFALSAEAAKILGGRAFFLAPNDVSLAFKVIGAGELFVLTPEAKSKALSKASELLRQGFSRVDGVVPFMPFGSNPADRAELWHRRVKVGDEFKLSPRWAIVCGFDASNQPHVSDAARPLTERERQILAAQNGLPSQLEEPPRDILANCPDYVVFVPRNSAKCQNRKANLGDLKKRGDSYNDHFQVIDDPKRGMLCAFWTQASWEGCADQHIAFSKSADKGLTWTDPVVLAGSECRAYPKLRASWQQPMLAKSGRLYCLWNQQTTSRGPHFGQMFGAYSDDAGETWSEPRQVPFPKRMDQDDKDPLVPPCWCNWQRPLRLGENGKFFVGCSRHGKADYDAKSCCKIEFWQFENIDDDPKVEDIRFSQFATNRDSLAADKVAPIPGVKYFVPTKHPYGGPEDPAVEEAAVVKLPDGRLFAMMRSSIGCPVWSQSRDGGRTWSGPKALLDSHGKPFPHPRSPCPLYDWKGPEAGSGFYFGLVHMTFDMSGETAYQARGPLYLIAGRFDPEGDQPIRFADPKLFAPRKWGNSFYASYTVLGGEGVLWFNDKKYYLLGRKVGPEWFK